MVYVTPVRAWPAFFLCLVFACGLAVLPSSAAADEGEPDLLDAVYANHTRWFDDALGVLELPLGIRAHFKTRYTWHLSPAAQLTSLHLSEVGPGLLKERFLESRIALSRPLTDKIELEIAWGTRNRVASTDPMSFQRQTIGALIRITP